MPSVGGQTRNVSRTEKRAAAPRKARVKAPSPTRVAKAQEQQYKSQGRAVRKVARQQRAEAPARAQEKQYEQPRSTETIKQVTRKARQKRLSTPNPKYRVKPQASIGSAPVQSVLEQTTRPLHGIAAAAKQDVRTIKEKGVAHYLTHGSPEARHAALRGLQNKDKSTFSDVLKEAGVKNKAVRGVVGFALDVAADPTTYVTGGGAAAVRKGALESAEKSAVRKATKAGLSPEQAARMGERAKARAAKKPQAGGVTVRVAGQEVPGVGKATAAAAKPVKAVVRKAPGRKTARAVAADVNPNVAPVGLSSTENKAAIQATRSARAKSAHGVHVAQQQALGIKKRIGEKNYNLVADAIESGNIKSLPEHLREPAVMMRSQFRYANRLRKQAGIRGGERANYLPHELTEDALKAQHKKASMGSGRRAIHPGYSKGRVVTRDLPLAELRKKFPGEYKENLAETFANRLAKGHEDVAKAELNRRIASMGRPVRKGRDPGLGENEAVFHVVGSNITELNSKQAQRVIETGKHDEKGMRGQYVVLNRDVEKRAREGVTPKLEGPGIIHVLDRATGQFKRLAIATPGFHVRNIIGDLHNAYLGQPGHRLAGNVRRGGKVLKAYHRQEKALRSLTPAQVGRATLSTPKYGKVTYDEVAKQLRDAGAFRSGYIARELPELAASGRSGLRRIRVPEAVKRAGLAREDLPRLTTAIEALRHGASWEEAAQAVADLHFDYQHLTQFERQIARRVAPFYTWSARNIPLQSKMLISRPGKYAQFEKVREEATKGSGVQGKVDEARGIYQQLEQAGVNVPKGWERALSEWEQRNAGIPVKWKGGVFTVSSGLPLQDLNEFPGAALSHQLDEYYQKSMSLTGPFPKDLIEFFDNHSFFFRDQLERDNSPLVAAPGWAKALPGWMKKLTGYRMIRDKKSGKMVPGWRGKADYVFRSVPGTPNYLNQIATAGTDRRGKNTIGKLLSWAGFKSVPVDPVKQAMDLAYARQAELERELAAVRQGGAGKDNPTPEWRRLSDQLKIVNQITYAAKSQLGYKVLPKAGGPSKAKGGVKFNDAGSGIKWNDQGSGVTWNG